MATLPTDDYCARRILSIFVDQHFCRPGDCLGAGNLRPTGDFTHDDLMRGLNHAGTQGWIQNGPNGSVAITPAGFAAGNGVIPSDLECARLILSVFSRHSPCRPGDVLRTNNFATAFTGTFKAPDFTRGLNHATAEGWVNQKNGGIELTPAGFAAI